MEKRSRSPEPVPAPSTVEAAATAPEATASEVPVDAQPSAKKARMEEPDNTPAVPIADATDADAPTASAGAADQPAPATSASGIRLGHMTEERAGMTQYINPDLPAFEGIIKQRFTDFMVNEITLGPEHTVCRITSLDPPEGKLLQDLRRARGEIDEAEIQRQEEEAERKRQQQEAEAQDTTWPHEADDQLSPYFTPDTLAALRKMWEEGINPPQAAAAAGEEATPAESATAPDEHANSEETAATAAPAEQGDSQARPARQAGRKSNVVQDDRKVLSRPLSSKAERTQAHAVFRELFHGKLATESIALANDKQDDDEDAQANAAAASGDASAAPKAETLFAVAVKWARRSDRRNKELLDEEAFNSPPYIHFYLQKTNRDHQEAMVLLAQALGLGGGPNAPRSKGASGTKDLSVAGTKDKRGVTVQRVALKRGRKTLDEVWKLVNGVDDGSNRGGGGGGGGGGRGRGGRGGGRGGFNGYGRGRTLLQAVQSRGDRGLRVAHLRYASEPFKLGQLSGNEFTVTLRNVKAPGGDESVIHKAMQTIRERGFINYYGMQRFGTGSVPTHEFGVLIFKGDYRGAVELLFEERDSDGDEMREAKRLYRAGRVEDAFHAAPRNCVAEKAVLDKMRRRNFTAGDYLGAFANIPRTLRLMYIHAFQSYIWNRLVSERIRRFGPDRPAVGDLVLLDGDDADEGGDGGADNDGQGEGEGEAEQDGVADGEVDGPATKPTSSSATNATTTTAGTPAWKRPAKVLTESDIATGSYSIHSVVMPLPGIDITLPSGWMSELYDSLLSESGLTPADLTQSKQEEYRLRGSYRKMIQLPRDFSYSLVRYTDPDVALTVADEDRCLGLLPEGSEVDSEPQPQQQQQQQQQAEEAVTQTEVGGEAESRNDVASDQAADPANAVGTESTPSNDADASTVPDPATEADATTATTATTTTTTTTTKTPRDPFLALLLNFKLPASAYATMLMREGLKSDTSSFKHRLMTQSSEDQAGKVRSWGGAA
ncbi:related to PUS7 - Pseudouridine synthase [Pseudozyma flocculosa]|uniref:Related to PUS7 - Pseudouridine synthase n=1 Tax=Pseudozyma flocculosa TaxID=84751 RepID=A0A5C3F5J3_9BASI|nr:related to PUS7 - Pseudouridine synthase [Pseudozyma flocculosa]